MTDDEFDRALDEFAAAVITTLRDKDYKVFPTTAQLVYPDRFVVKSLADDGDLVEFGRVLALQGNPIPAAAFVAESGDSLQVRISGSSDGRRNAMRISLERTRWRKFLRPMQIERLYCRDRALESASADDLLRGWTEKP